MTRRRAGERVPPEILVLAAIGFCSALGFGMVGPSLAAVSRTFDVGAAVVSLAISGFAVVRLCSNLTLGRFLGRWPLRRVLAAGLGLQAVFSIAAGLSVAFPAFLAFRAASGIGSAAFTLSATALVILVAPEAVRAAAMSIYFTAISVGTVAGPAVGGAVAALDPMLPLVVYGALLAVAAMIAVVALRRIRTLRSGGGGGQGDDQVRLRSLLADRRFVAAASCNVVVGWVFYGMLNSTIPVFLGRSGVEIGAVGLLIALAAGAQIATSALSGTVTGRFGLRAPLIVALAIATVAIGSFGLWRTAPAFAGCLLLAGAAAGVLATTAPNLLAQVPGGSAGTAIGIYWVAFDLAAIVGPVVAGVLADRIGFESAFVAGAVVLASAIVAVSTIGPVRTGHRPPTIGPVVDDAVDPAT